MTHVIEILVIYDIFEPIKLVLPRHFLLKCLYQAMESGRSSICIRGIDLSLFLRFWYCFDSVILLFFHFITQMGRCKKSLKIHKMVTHIKIKIKIVIFRPSERLFHYPKLLLLLLFEINNNLCCVSFPFNQKNIAKKSE